MKTARHRVDLFLAPGRLTVQTRPMHVKTILGSCVAVCLWDGVARVGGLNHFLLAHPGPGEVPDARFGSFATVQLIERMARAGADRGRLDAAVVGGGHPIPSLKDSRIGDANAAVALEVLAAQGIAVSRRDTGGSYGRKLLFDTGTGGLLVRRLRNRLDTGRVESRW